MHIFYVHLVHLGVASPHRSHPSDSFKRGMITKKRMRRGSTCHILRCILGWALFATFSQMFRDGTICMVYGSADPESDIDN